MTPNAEKPDTNIVAPPCTSKVPHAVPLSFAVLGATIGLFTGMSESPVAATVVGAFFGLLGGAGVFTLLRGFDGSPVAATQMRSVAICLGSLCLGAVLFVFIGIELREGRFSNAPTPNKHHLESIPIPKEVPAMEFAKLAILDRELSRLGITPEVHAEILRRFISNEVLRTPYWDPKQIVLMRKQAEKSLRAVERVFDQLDEPKVEINALLTRLKSEPNSESKEVLETIDALEELINVLDESHDAFVDTEESLSLLIGFDPMTAGAQLSDLLEWIRAYRRSFGNGDTFEAPQSVLDAELPARRRSIRP